MTNRPEQQHERQRSLISAFIKKIVRASLVRAELHKVSVSSHLLPSFPGFLSPLLSAHPIQLQGQVRSGLLGQMFTSSVNSHPLSPLSALPLPFPFQPFFCGEVYESIHTGCGLTQKIRV